jgi:hypothetical protein
VLPIVSTQAHNRLCTSFFILSTSNARLCNSCVLAAPLARNVWDLVVPFNCAKLGPREEFGERVREEEEGEVDEDGLCARGVGNERVRRLWRGLVA